MLPIGVPAPILPEFTVEAEYPALELPVIVADRAAERTGELLEAVDGPAIEIICVQRAQGEGRTPGCRILCREPRIGCQNLLPVGVGGLDRVLRVVGERIVVRLRFTEVELHRGLDVIGQVVTAISETRVSL